MVLDKTGKRDNKSAGILIGVEKGKLSVSRGQDKGTYDLNDLGFGASLGLEASISLEIVNFYTSAAKVSVNHFYGKRFEGNFSVSFAHVSVGATFFFGTHDEGFSLGYGGTIGVDALPFNIDFDVNKGILHKTLWI